MWFELYQDSCRTTREPWRWRLLASQDSVLALAACGYTSEEACREALTTLAPGIRVVVRSSSTAGLDMHLPPGVVKHRRNRSGPR